MKIRHKPAILVFLLVAIGASAITLLLPRQKPDYLPVSLRIERTYRGRQCWLGMVSLGADDVVYTLEELSGQPVYRAYSPQGKQMWCAGHRISKDVDQALIALPGCGTRCLYPHMGEGEQSGSGVGRKAWVAVSARGDIMSRALQPTPGVTFLAGVSAQDALYAAGYSEAEGTVAAKFDRRGRKRWLRLEGFPGLGGFAALDGAGNLLVSDGPGKSYTVDVRKYSSSGRLVWRKSVITSAGGASTVWLGPDEHRNVLLVVNTGYVIVLSSDSEFELFRRHGSKGLGGTGTGLWDESGRDQQYALITLDPNGKLLRKRVLSRGGWLNIVDAAFSSRRELYLLGNRNKVNRYRFPTARDNAQLIKCDAEGNVLWSGIIKLPERCYATGIVLGRKGEIYVFGDNRNVPGEGASLSRLFIYRIIPPQ